MATICSVAMVVLLLWQQPCHTHLCYDPHLKNSHCKRSLPWEFKTCATNPSMAKVTISCSVLRLPLFILWLLLLLLLLFVFALSTCSSSFIVLMWIYWKFNSVCVGARVLKATSATSWCKFAESGTLLLNHCMKFISEVCQSFNYCKAETVK